MEEYENIPRYRTAFRDRPRARGGIGVRRKKRSVKPAFSFRENKRLLQLGCCVLIFLLVLAGRALLPERTAEMRKAVLAVLEHDMDFRAAFASIGEAVSGGEPIRDALSELYISVFGRSAEPEEQNDTIPESGEASAPENRAQSNTAEETKDTAADEADGGMDIIIPEPVTFQGERKFLSLAAVDTAAFLTRRFGASAATQEKAYTVSSDTGHGATGAGATEAIPSERTKQEPSLPERATLEKINLSIRHRDPVSGPVSSGFGWRIHPKDGILRFHYGIDIAAEKGTPIAAFSDGTVSYTGESTEYGLYLCISHEDNTSTFYAHCSKVSVKKGQKVSVGQKIAEVGNTGNSTGCHLHFEVRKDGKYLDPAWYYGIA